MNGSTRRRCKYLCYIEEHEARPLFKVKVVEKGHDDVVLTGATPTGSHHGNQEQVSILSDSL